MQVWIIISIADYVKCNMFVAAMTIKYINFLKGLLTIVSSCSKVLSGDELKKQRSLA